MSILCTVLNQLFQNVGGNNGEKNGIFLVLTSPITLSRNPETDAIAFYTSNNFPYELYNLTILLLDSITSLSIYMIYR